MRILGCILDTLSLESKDTQRMIDLLYSHCVGITFASLSWYYRSPFCLRSRLEFIVDMNSNFQSFLSRSSAFDIMLV